MEEKLMKLEDEMVKRGFMCQMRFDEFSMGEFMIRKDDYIVAMRLEEILKASLDFTINEMVEEMNNISNI